ncbi:MarR family winged helix-turn-helix transcriptional regulator [Streptomyces blattellae]|uniref:MarR family winged helix-turn-helix transcriptional regulator n=1 Tax=Streptomyces blattellae TaxID=2569855 RepID=UPI0012B9F931|nr:MarR family winged helix-turn-helix transcriptional regulator [Streptomyces blattellae]
MPRRAATRPATPLARRPSRHPAADETAAGGESHPPDEAVFAVGGLLRTVQQVHDRLWQELVPGGYTSPQFAVLHRLRMRPDIDQRTLGEGLSLDKATVADLVARMDQAGLIGRERAAGDAGRYTLRLTGTGRAVFTGLAPWVAQVQLRLTAALGPQDTGRFLRLMQTVTSVIPGAWTPTTPALVLIGLPADPAHNPGYLVRVAQQRHTRYWADAVGTRLTAPQQGVLHRLAREPGIDQTTLAERVALPKAPAGEIVKRLTARGEVQRTPDPHDGRRKLLTLTSKGFNVLYEVMPAAREVQRRLTQDLTADERDELLALLGRLSKA